MKIFRAQRGDIFFPQYLLTEDDAPEEIWQIFITMREGLQPSKTSILDFRSYEAAVAFQKKHPVGSDFDDLIGDEELDRGVLRSSLASDNPFGVSAGDEVSPLAFEILDSAGIYQNNFDRIAREVVEYLGQARIDEIKANHGEHWQVVAAFEYCWLQLPHSSPAFAAAAYQYHHYVTEDDFSAGYHWRDLEIMVHKVEVQALKIIETRARAGQSGSKKSTQARNKRRIAFFAMIEELASCNPDMIKFLSVKDAAKLAVNKCAEQNPSLWRQGKGQVIDYLDEIRRGEAGADLQKRYEKVFGHKPPKRFK